MAWLVLCRFDALLFFVAQLEVLHFVEFLFIGVVLVRLELDAVRLRLQHVEETKRDIQSSDVLAFESEEVCKENCIQYQLFRTITVA